MIIKDYLVSNGGIRDESRRLLPDLPTERGLTLLAPIFSSRGEDHVFLRVKGDENLRREFGSDVGDLKRHGQGGLNTLQHLRGGGDALVYRLTSPDAKKANTLISVDVLHRTDIPQYQRLPNGVFALDNDGNRIPLMDSEDPPQPIVAEGYELSIVSENVEDVDAFTPVATPQTGGVVRYPLVLLEHHARGKCGESYGISIIPDTSSDQRAKDGRRYILMIYSVDEYGTVKETEDPVYFSLNPKAVFPGTTAPEGLNRTYENILNEGTAEERRNPIQLKYFTDMYDELLQMVGGAVEGKNTDIDILFGLDKDRREYDRLIVSETSLDLQNSTLFLSGGSDGSLQIGETVKDSEGNDVVVDAARVSDTKKSLLIDFFNCDLNPDILNETVVDAHIVYDGNYPMDVKSALLSGLVQYRPNIIRFADCGITKSAREAILVYSTLSGFVEGDYSMGAYIVGPAGVTNEPNVEPQEVTYTYELARRIPEIWRTYGKFTAPAGWGPGQVRYMKLYWHGRKTKDDEIGELRKRGIWFAQKENDRIVQYIEESQYSLDDEVASKLEYFRFAAPTMDALLEAKKIAVKYPYDPRTPEESINAVRDEAVEFFANRYASQSINVDVQIFQTKRDLLEETATMEVIFNFGGLIKRFRFTVVARRA